MSAETFEFQAQARQLLNLVVNSIYSNKEIFLRELLSNASDAMDKLRLKALTDSELKADTSDLHIRLKPDPEKRTLTVIDNGIGMNREDLKGLIGTIARSGTAEFLSKMKEEGSNAGDLIGQFGVGFYSVFMVADKVVIETRKIDEETGTRWESAGEGSYTLDDAGELPQGTSITLHLKPTDAEDGIDDYTSEWTLRRLVKKYSDFLSYPIKMQVVRTKPTGNKKEDGTDETETVTEDETLNSMKALWARPQSEVKPEEYNEFYKHTAHDWEDPLETIAMKGEGSFEFQSLLFIPKHAPIDLYMPEHQRGVQLYVKRVFIMDRCEELVPEYLRFLRGVVDAQDLSLNISREILQKDRQIRAISKGLTRKTLAVLKSMKADDAEKYKVFWKEFGQVLKEGLMRDHDQQKSILEISWFPSTNSEEPTDLEGYISRMKEGQDSIYYITGENRSAIENSPHLEMFREKGYEVLLLTDPVDSIWPEAVGTYKEKAFKSVLSSEIDLSTDDEKKEAEEKLESQRKDLAAMLAWMGTGLEEKVKEVRVSPRLKQSPACLVTDVNDPSPAMEKIMKAMGHAIPPVKRIMEINPEHTIIKRLHELYSEKGSNEELKEISELLYDQALIAEGGELPDPSRFSNLLTSLMERTLK